MPEDDDKARQLELVELEAVLKSDVGRSVLNRLLSVTGFAADTFDPDAYVSARNAGGRMIGVWLWNEMNEASPEMVIKMLQENAHG